VVRQRTALKCFTHFAFTDEVDQKIFDEAGVPALWWPQAADHQFFTKQTDWTARKQQVFFCGKVWDEYPLRRALLDALKEANLCHIASQIPTGDLVTHYNRFAFAINLPGVLGGYNARAYEAMSCGSLLFQFRPANRPRNNSLFKDGVHCLLFDPTDVQGLRTLVQKAIEQPPLAADIARRGHKEFLARHTMERRLEQLLAWISGNATPEYFSNDAVANQASSVPQPVFVNDRYLFEGRPVEKEDSLNEFADLQFLPYGNLIAKTSRRGEQFASAGDDAQALRALKQALSADSDLPEVHNNLGVLCWNRGERHRAFRHFEAALLENPSYRPAIINFGEALEASGEKARACDLYSRHLQSAADDTTVQMLLQSIQ
jgi:tetratricopeptide (TPR) repeat protein